MLCWESSASTVLSSVQCLQPSDGQVLLLQLRAHLTLNVLKQRQQEVFSSVAARMDWSQFLVAYS